MKRDEMGHRCCGKHKVKRGLWSPEEDAKLLRYITTHGHPSWSSVPKLAGFTSLSNSLTTFSFINQTLISIYTYVRGIIMSFQPKIIWQ